MSFSFSKGLCVQMNSVYTLITGTPFYPGYLGTIILVDVLRLFCTCVEMLLTRVSPGPDEWHYTISVLVGSTLDYKVNVERPFQSCR